MPCGITDPLGCPGQLVGQAAGSAWKAICMSFATAADALLKDFAQMFTAIPPVNLTSPGVKDVYGICLGVAGVIAALLLLGQVIRTALTHDGSGLAEGLIGVAKAAAAFMLTLVITSAAVTAADGLTTYIIDRSFGSATALTGRITHLLAFTGTAGPSAGGVAIPASLLLLLAIIGMLLIIVLWFELLLRNAAIAVLVATFPIAAAGQVSSATRSWWPKMAAATAQLIILKPVIALVFALGLELTGRSRDVETLLAGMLILLLAAVAWPVVARFLTFATARAGNGGLGLVLGFAAGRLSAGGGGPAGGMPSGGGEAAGAEGAAAGGAAAGVMALAAAGVQAAHKTATALAGRMDQVAGHAGLDPTGTPATPAGSPGGPGRGAPGSSGGAPGGSGGGAPAMPAGGPPSGSFEADAGSDWPEEWPYRETGRDWPEHYPADSGDGWAEERPPPDAEPPPAPDEGAPPPPRGPGGPGSGTGGGLGPSGGPGPGAGGAAGAAGAGGV